jgi:putative transposase
VRPSYKKEMANWLVSNYRVSIQRACRCVKLVRAMYYYKRHRRDDTLLAMKEIANTRVRYGFRRIFVLLKREGFSDNHKRVYRVYKACGLNLRTKRPRRSRSAEHRLERLDTQGINKVWSMDFVQDALFNGERFRVLTVVDNCTGPPGGKICHALLAGKSLRGIDVVGELGRICLIEGRFPGRIQCDNGSEFISKEMDLWAYSNSVTLDFSRPGKPTDNPYVESFNGKFRDECLSVNWFLPLDDAREKIEDFRWEYNHFRPHSALNDLTPKEFVNLHQETPETLLSTV